MSDDRISAVFNTSLGWAGVSAAEKGICRIVLPGKGKKTVAKELQCAVCGVTPADRYTPAASRILVKAVKLIEKYLSGERVSFDVPVDLDSFTSFQRAVWRATAEIPYGETRSYGWIAKKIGNPQAVRAVGQALGSNPVPIIVP